MRVFGVDPGLTRCGVGIVDVAPDRTARLVHVGVVRTDAQLALERRLLLIGDRLEELMDEHRPDSFAIERVFAQHNLRTVMGVAQISGIAMAAAARRGLPVGMHTPSEVKSAITGYGNAQKKQVQVMVARILSLAEEPKPADAADALAIALCHAWRAGTATGGDAGRAATPAQERWRAAEAAAARGPRPRRLSE